MSAENEPRGVNFVSVLARMVRNMLRTVRHFKMQNGSSCKEMNIEVFKSSQALGHKQIKRSEDANEESFLSNFSSVKKKRVNQ